MGIRSIFTSHEKLFAEWMMQHEFNQEIQAEPRFSEEKNQNLVMESYYTISKKSPSVIPTINENEAIRQARLTGFNISAPTEKELAREEARKSKLGLSSQSINLDLNDINNGARRQVELVPKKKFISTSLIPVHGQVVETVEKTSSVKDVQYGDFWGRTNFAKTEKKHTGYFLIDGWLVVSVPEKIKERLYEINDDIDITVAIKYDEGLDPVASKIAGYIKDWFQHQREQLATVSAACIAGSALFSVLVRYFGDIDSLPGMLLGLSLVISSIAMYAMVFYSGVKLYQLYGFREKMNSVKNLGDWVKQVRCFARDYPGLGTSGLPDIDKFLTPKEFGLIINPDRNVQTYARRFFQKISGLLSFS